MNKTLKKTLSIILTILMIVTSVPFAFAVDGHTHALSADGENVEFTEFTADITKIYTEANYYLTENIELTEALNINLEGTVNLCLNGHSITTTAKTTNNTVIMLISGTLNLCDCQGGGYITSSEDLSLSGVFGVNDSEFNMYSGEFKGLGSAGLRGGVNINMYGGKITGCKEGVYNATCFNMYGGEISGCDRAVYISSAEREFTMHGGKIINNETTGNSYAPVNVASAAFTMNGGEISGNQTSGWGAVHIDTKGSFTMNGGKISDNVGYGVCNYGNTTINAGEISGNTDAGIFVTDTSTLTLKGGKITNNGSGIKAFSSVTAYLVGDGVQVTGNKDGDVSYYVSFEVSAQLTPEKTQIGMSDSGKAFARPNGTNITTLEGMEACFYGTDHIFQVVKCDNGELSLVDSYPYIYENENGDYVVETPFVKGMTFEWFEDDKLLENETSAVLSKDKIQPGNKYICLVLVDGAIEAGAGKECPSRIVHQPTAGEPYVEVNDDTDASYQWYVIENGTIDITKENANAFTPDFIGAPEEMYMQIASYDPLTGWTGSTMQLEDNIVHSFFAVELKAGETISVTLSEVPDDCSFETLYGDIIVDAETEDGKNITFTVPEDGHYSFHALYNGPLYATASMDGVTYTELEDETSAELKTPEFGKKYACEVTYGDGKKEKTAAFEYVYAIAHQPTEAEPYVELNDNTDASYQWYSVEGDGAEITDKNASGDWQSMGLPFDNSVYEDGKWIADDSYGMQYYFMVDLEAGDTINFEFASEVEGIIFDVLGGSGEEFAVGDTKYSITVEEAGAYLLVTPPVDYVRAYTGGITYTAIDGETAAAFTPTALGKYACEVTFADGTKEMSETFEVTKLHDCDYSGEWKYDGSKHWKECAVDNCDKTAEEAVHAFEKGECTVCDYVCLHESYIDGVCDNCKYECPHDWNEGALTRPTATEKGYYTYTCELCGDTYTEEVESADCSACNDLSTKVFNYSLDETLTEEARAEIYQNYQNFINNNSEIINKFGFIRDDLIASEQGIVNEATAELQEIVDAIEAKIASGEYVKADYTEIDEAIAEIETKLADENITDEGKAGLEKIKAQLTEMKADENTSAADVAELEKALEDYETELDAGIADGTLVEVDGKLNEIVSEIIQKWSEKLESEGLTDEYEDFINNNKATDEALAAEKEIADFAYSLEGTVADNAENLAKLEEMLNSLLAELENCLRGTHNFKDYEITTPAKCGVNAKETGTCWLCGETDEREVPGTALEHLFLEYTSNGDATCEADGTKTATCLNGCGTEDTVADEGSQLDHADEDGDKVCDDCEAEIVDVCPDCGRPVHEEKGIPQFICLIIMLIRLVTSFFNAVK